MAMEADRNRRILVIDDDEVMRELLGTLLGVYGFNVQVAGSGDEALQMLRQPDAPLLVLTDLQMPGLSGESLTEGLRDNAGPSTIIVGMSGRRPSDAVLRPLDAFLPKPFEPAEVEKAFHDARRVREAHPEIRSALQITTTTFAPDDDHAQSEPPLDDTIFTALTRSFSPAQMMELYNLTLDDVAKRHARMLTHAEEDDFDAVRREAHAVKGACGMVGARELQQLATQVEKAVSLSTADLAPFPTAAERLRRTLNTKLQQKW